MAIQDERRAALRRYLLSMAGALAGAALVPWLTWIAAGFVGCAWLASASFALGCVYILCIHRLSLVESALRKARGRRHEPLPPEIGTAVALGLAVCFILPALSASALADAVGVPRLQGDVQSYEPADLADRGARISLETWVALPRERIDLLAAARATVLAPEAGRTVVFATTWLADGKRLCIQGADLWCLDLDPGSGRLSQRGVQVGRVSRVGGGGASAAGRSGLPWELENLFRNADVL